MNPKLLQHALDEDTRARAAALTAASFIVEAPAGAGKTELLTQRFLRLLADVDSPEDVVAITFTNKAAAEMRERVLGALERASRGESPDKPHQRLTLELAGAAMDASERGRWDLLGQPARLRILTIDSLCAAIARQMPLLSRFGEQPAIARDPGTLYAEAARQTVALLDEEGADGDAHAAPVAEALAWLDNDAERLTRLLVGMLGRREQWLGAVSVDQESDAALALLIGAELADIAATVGTRWQALMMPLARFAAANVDAGSPIAGLADWDTALPASVEALPRWRALVELVLTREGEWRKTVNVRQGFPAGKEHKAHKEGVLGLIAEGAATPGLGAALARVADLPSPGGREAEDAVVRGFARLLRLAVANLWSVFRARGEVDFAEIAMRAIAALAEPGGDGDAPGPSDLALRLDDRIRHLLVDEFQDTSPSQVALIERLTAGWSAGDGRTLFCVGDPMQSIYRFRKADVALFLKAGLEGIGSVRLERLTLCRNNRSLPAVVDWINAAFSQTFPAADRMFTGAVALRPSVATRNPDGSAAAGVYFHPLAGTGDAAADDRAEADCVLERIDAARADPVNRSIAVLVRARTHLAPLVAEIRRRRPDLRFQAVEVEALGDRPWIADLLVVTRALLHRADRVHWLALLRSPLVGLTLADLCALAEDDHQTTLWRLLLDSDRIASLSDDGQRRVAHLTSVFAEAFAAQGRVPLARWVEGVWLLLDGPATLPDRGAVEDCEACLALLAELDQSGRFAPDHLEAEVGRLYAAPDPQADESLRLMTIHKSKGLEFDTVILPGLHRTVKGSDPQMLLWDEVVVPGEPPRLLVAPVPPRGIGRAAAVGGPSAYDYLKDLERRRSRNEDLRVLYVAATRARRSLHLVGTLAAEEPGAPGASGGHANTAGIWAKPPANTPLSDLWGALATMAGGGPDGTKHAAKGAETEVEPGMFSPPSSRLKSARRPFLLSARPAAPVPSAPVEGTAGDADRTSALFGTLAHRYLQIIADSEEGLAAWGRPRIEAALAAMVWWLEQRGARDAEALARRLVAVLADVVQSDRGRWVLARRDDSAAELALGGHGRISVIDRSFVEDGVRWIIDYKTTPTDGLGAAAVGRLAESHRPQLEAYAALFADGELPVRLAVFFIDGLHWIELPLGGGTGATK